MSYLKSGIKTCRGNGKGWADRAGSYSRLVCRFGQFDYRATDFDKGSQDNLEKMVTVLGEITPQVIDSLSDEELQQFGITFKKWLTSNRQHKKSYRVNLTSNPLGQCRTKRSVPNL